MLSSPKDLLPPLPPLPTAHSLAISSQCFHLHHPSHRHPSRRHRFSLWKSPVMEDEIRDNLPQSRAATAFISPARVSAGNAARGGTESRKACPERSRRDGTHLRRLR